jgi:hypothetical protein
VFVENPIIGKNTKVPTRDTGMVRMGMSVARQFWRKTNTTRITSPIASSSVMTISFAPSVTGTVVSSVSATSISDGNFWPRRDMVAFARLAASSAFDPGTW